MKKIFIFALAVVAVCCSFAAFGCNKQHKHNYIGYVCDCGAVDPNAPETTKGLEFEDNGNGSLTVKIASANAIGRLLKIPASHNGKAVTGIADNNWSNWSPEDSSQLICVVIPDSITSISSQAFLNCSIKFVHITDIAAWCGISFEISHPFYEYNLYLNNTLVSKLTIPDSVTSISERAFYSCSSLTSVAIGNGVTSIGEWAFSGCSSLRSVTISDSVTSIGICTFQECPLTSIFIPDGVTSIGDRAFDCTSLTKITVGTGNTKYHSAENCLIDTATKKLIVGCKNSVIPTDCSVTSIGDYAFYGCSSLTSITLPDSVASIGNYAFRECTALKSVTSGCSFINVGYSAFAGCTSLTTVIMNSFNSRDGVYMWNAIGDSTFYGCSSLTSIILPKQVNFIGIAAFYGCTSLTSITIPKRIGSIGHNAFEDCTSLKNVTFEKTVDWKADETDLSSDDLANTQTAAKYLTDTYVNFNWSGISDFS